MRSQMDACMLFRRTGSEMAAPSKIAYEEQDEDIGSASGSGSTSRSSAASSSSELADDASSSSSSSSSSADHFEMSALMTQLPFKSGLSKFFDGKSQSFASLAAVASLEDLAKPARKRLKPSRSCGVAWTRTAAASSHRAGIDPGPRAPGRRPRGPPSRCSEPRRGGRRWRSLQRRGWPATLWSLVRSLARLAQHWPQRRSYTPPHPPACTNSSQRHVRALLGGSFPMCSCSLGRL